MNNEEYEIISHNHNYHLFIVNLLYRTPHIHKDFEIGIVLNGSPIVIQHQKEISLSTNDIFILNPFQSHEIKSDAPCTILTLQISPLFFSSYFPEMEFIEFKSLVFDLTPSNTNLRNLLFHLARNHFTSSDYQTIKCSILVNQIFLILLLEHPYHIINDKERNVFLTKGSRMRRISNYIDEHYKEKLLLSDIAEAEHLDLYYLSHFFKESFGVTFQNYLNKLRCEHARQLLLLTDSSLLDISLQCGFSAQKYLNKAFFSQYGCSPKDYRLHFQLAEMPAQQQSLLTTQEFLSPSSSLVTLQKYEKSLNLH